MCFHIGTICSLIFSLFSLEYSAGSQLTSGMLLKVATLCLWRRSAMIKVCLSLIDGFHKKTKSIVQIAIGENRLMPNLNYIFLTYSKLWVSVIVSVRTRRKTQKMIRQMIQKLHKKTKLMIQKLHNRIENQYLKQIRIYIF